MSEAADLLAQFRLLLDRYLPVVMAAALPCLGGDQQLEENAAQLVLRGLAEKAPTLAKDSSLHAWLYRHAFHPASRLARSERRRAKPETNYASTAMDETDANADGLSDILPRLLLGLSASDRDLVITRFFEQLSFRIIDETRSISEDTGQKRVSRTLERLRKELAAMGITSLMALHADLLARQWEPPPLLALVARILSECQPSMVTGSTSFLGIGGSR
jgi:RNA polymerase sigma factor (sigma-70 family)